MTSANYSQYLVVCSNLSFKIRQVVLKVPCPWGARYHPWCFQCLHQFSFIKHSLLHQVKALKACTFLNQTLGVWRHGSWCDSPNVCMMSTARHKEYRLALTPRSRSMLFLILGVYYMSIMIHSCYILMVNQMHRLCRVKWAERIVM